jgi:GNAT superfamily N-acetyltransferase
VEKFHLRDMEGQDAPFIFSSWLKSYRESPAVRSVPNQVYYKQHHALIENIFLDPNCVAIVAHPPGEPNVIAGYLVAEKYEDSGLLVVHWAYVKHSYRGQGLFRQLVEEAKEQTLIHCFTHFTTKIRQPAKEAGFIYNPYFLYRI